MVPQEKRRSSGEKPIRNCRQGAAAGSIDVEPDLLNWEIETNTKQNKTGPKKKRSLKKTAFKFQFAISLSLATPWWILIYMKLDQTFTKYICIKHDETTEPWAFVSVFSLASSLPRRFLGIESWRYNVTICCNDNKINPWSMNQNDSHDPGTSSWNPWVCDKRHTSPFRTVVACRSLSNLWNGLPYGWHCKNMNGW